MLSNRQEKLLQAAVPKNTDLRQVVQNCFEPSILRLLWVLHKDMRICCKGVDRITTALLMDMKGWVFTFCTCYLSRRVGAVGVLL